MGRNLFESMDLNLLRVFAMLMIESSVTRSAEKLCLTQSAISNALRRLRTTFDDPLFVRSSHGVTPSPVALDLWERLAPHYRALGQELHPDVFDPALYEGRFTISMSDYTSARVMPRLVTLLQDEAPGVRLHVVAYSTSNLPHRLERAGVDLTLGTNLDDARQYKELRTHALWPIHVTCFMRKGHPLSHGPLTLGRFLTARHVDVLFADMALPLYDSLLHEHGHRRNLAVTLNQYNDILALIARSDYIGVLPTSLLDLSNDGALLCQRTPPITIPVRWLVMTWHQRHDVRPAHAWLRKRIVELFATHEVPSGAQPSRSAAQASVSRSPLPASNRCTAPALGRICTISPGAGASLL